MEDSACLKYLALNQAIPRMWKKISDSNCANSGVWFKSGKDTVKLSKCTTKFDRKAMQSQISSKPICQNLWENKCANDNFDWGKIWKTSVNNVKEPRLKTFNWKIISNIYPTKVFLEKIKKESTNI